jgi:hypothetical protein
MAQERVIPDDPIDFIRRCCRERKIGWTYHVNMRMSQRFVAREIILASVDSFEIIEEYPQDKYLPSYLIYARHEALIFHVQIAVDVVGDNVRIVTAYVPTQDKWEADLKTRRKR